MNNVENETDQESRLAERLKRVSSAAISIVTALLVGFVGYIMVCSARGRAVEVFGRCVLKVVTGSMEPSLHVGDYIYVKKADAVDLSEGDIISFYSEDPDVYGKIVTHRIKEVRDDGTYITQGDANNVQDGKAVRYDQVIGKYQGKARFYRWVGSFGDRKKLLLILVIIPMTLIALYEVKTITKLGIEVKREKELSAEDKEKLIREAIDREKERLEREGFTPEKTPEEEKISSETDTEDTETAPEEEAEPAGELKLPEKEVDTVESGKDNEG